MNKKTKELYYTIWMVSIAACLVLALFALFLPSCTSRPAAAEAAPQAVSASDAASAEPDTTQAEATAAPVSTVLPETEDAGEAYLSRIVILGDTISTHYCDLGLLSSGQVWTGESAETTVSDAASGTISFYGEDSTSHSISTAVGSETPDIVIIALGSYGLTDIDETTFKVAYSQIVSDIQSASPGTTVICQSIFPILESSVDDGTTNDMIRQANDWILSVAEDCGVHYLNTYEVLADSTENLFGIYAEEDGRTLTDSGCDAVMTYIRTHTL